MRRSREACVGRIRAADVDHLRSERIAALGAIERDGDDVFHLRDIQRLIRHTTLNERTGGTNHSNR